MKHNNALPNAHFRKHWQNRVKTWFDQAGRKKRRRVARIEKAKRMAPRPTELLRPAVHCPTIKFNTRLRAGRGFTLDEIKSVGITASYAKSVGISVDHRRRNRSEESLELNKKRLQAYLSRLEVFRNGNGVSVEQRSVAKEFPVTQDKTVEPARAITAEEKEASVYATLRRAWSTKRYAGIRAKRAAEKAEAMEIKEKK